MKRYRATASSWPIFKKLAISQAMVLIIAILSGMLVHRHFLLKGPREQEKTFLIESVKSLSFILEQVGDTQAVCKHFQERKELRVSLLSLEGDVLCDSDHDPKLMDNHFNRPEVKEAMKGSSKVFSRKSKTLGVDMLYSAALVNLVNGKKVIVRPSFPLDRSVQSVKDGQKTAYLILVPLMLAASLISLFIILLFESKEEQRVSQLKGDLVSNISHEVKTPMTAIKGYLQILDSQNSDRPQEEKKLLKKLAKNVNRLNQLFSDILSLSSIERSQGPYAEMIDLEELTTHIVSNVRLAHKRKTIDLELEVSSTPIYSDPVLTENIITNLLDNAFKYTPDGGKVSCEISVQDQRVHLSVVDSGIGMSKEDSERVFERFFRVDVSRSRELGGTGLGLAIVKHSVNKLGGSVWIDSEVGRGSSFTIEWPEIR